MSYMSNSKLGLFVQVLSGGEIPWMRKWIETYRPRIIKTMAREMEPVLRGLPYNPIVIGRKYFDSQPLKDPKGVAGSIANDSLGKMCQEGLIDAMEAYNEIDPHDGRCWQYVDWQLELEGHLNKYGIPYVAGSWSVGCPDEVLWKCYICGWKRLLEKPAGWRCPKCGNLVEARITYWDDPRVHELMTLVAYLGLHEYSAESMWEPRGFDPPYADKGEYIRSGWFTLRYRQVRAQLEEAISPSLLPNFLITECGIDGGAAHWPISGQGGYKSFTRIGGYLEQLGWYDQQLQIDGYVGGGTPFLFKGTKEWWSFDLVEHEAQYGKYLQDCGWTDGGPGPEPGQYKSHYVLLPQEASARLFVAVMPYVQHFRVTMGQSHDDAAKIHGALGHHITMINVPPEVKAAVKKLAPQAEIDEIDGTEGHVANELADRMRNNKRY